LVVEAGNLLGESPVWDDRRGALWWVDIHGRSLHRWSEIHGHGAWPLPEQTACIGLCEGEGFICATRSGFSWFDPASGRRETLAQPLAGAKNVRFNDGRCDRRGRFWSGTVHELRDEGKAALYRLDPDGTCAPMFGDVTVSNGIAFSPDERTLYFADSHAKAMYAIAYDAMTGTLGERRLFVRFEPAWGMPDGATVDAEGCVWVAAIGGSRVLRFDPEGCLVREYPMPVSQPTSCEFGGDDLRTLYVTSARMRLDDEALFSQPLAGSLFALDVGVGGLAEPRYRGSVI
jgi:sugar lactone lactonase YvrE